MAARASRDRRAGVVLAASYEAKAYGVRSAMGGRQAARLRPDALVVPPRFSAYVEASRQVFAIFEDTTPLVEGIRSTKASSTSVGCVGWWGAWEGIAIGLRHRVREEVGLPISVGIAGRSTSPRSPARSASPTGC